MIKIESDRPDRIIVSFPYSPQIVAKLRTIKTRQWNPAGKYWSFPHSKPALHEILTALVGEEIEIGPSLHALDDLHACAEQTRTEREESFGWVKSSGHPAKQAKKGTAAGETVLKAWSSR